jgi:MSHA pilin protein MshC
MLPERPAGKAAGLRFGCLAPGGFTLIELTVVLLLIGILAVAVAPRFANRAVFDERGFVDQVRAAIQFARKSAVAQRRNVCVAVSGGGLNITRAQAAGASAACTVALVDPATGGAFVASAPAGVSLSPAVNLVFDALGRLASPDATTAITVSGLDASVVTVERETGHVH